MDKQGKVNAEATKVITHGKIRVELLSDGSVKIQTDNYLVVQPRTGNSILVFNTDKKIEP